MDPSPIEGLCSALQSLPDQDSKTKAPPHPAPRLESLSDVHSSSVRSTKFGSGLRPAGGVPPASP